MSTMATLHICPIDTSAGTTTGPGAFTVDPVLFRADVLVQSNDVGYQGPLSVEWEDIRMDRVHGATEASAFVRSVDFPPSTVAFDSAFDKENQ